MQLRSALGVAMLSIVAGCSSADVVVDGPPFINETCYYNDLGDLEKAAISAAPSSNLKLNIRVHDRDAGAFSILLWRKGYNIILAGVPDTRNLQFSAVTSTVVTKADVEVARVIMQRLPIKC